MNRRTNPAKNLYSVAFYPSAECLEDIAQMKSALKQAIGWYNTSGLDAHIMVNVFLADEQEISSTMGYLDHFASRTSPKEVAVDKFEEYAQTFYLAPDENSTKSLKSLMSIFNASFPLKAHKSYDPHISIARQLTRDRMLAARMFFEDKSPDLHFRCDKISLRRFDPVKQQYKKEKDFVFGRSSFLPRQLALFD